MSDETEPTTDKHGISLAKPTQERWDDIKMRDQIGIFADVERSKVLDETAYRSNRALNDIGDFIHANNDTVRNLEYVGSAAVHIYLARAIGEAVFVCQTKPLLECEERIAGPAFTDLQKNLMSHYGRKTTKIRSGF